MPLRQSDESCHRHLQAVRVHTYLPIVFVFVVRSRPETTGGGGSIVTGSCRDAWFRGHKDARIRLYEAQGTGRRTRWPGPFTKTLYKDSVQRLCTKLLSWRNGRNERAMSVAAGSRPVRGGAHLGEFPHRTLKDFFICKPAARTHPCCTEQEKKEE